MKIKNLLKEGRVEEILSSNWGISFQPLLLARYTNKKSLYDKGLISKEEFDAFVIHCITILNNYEDINIPLFKIGDKVEPSRTCRPLYGDPTYLVIRGIQDNKYKTDLYLFWFEEHELSLLNPEN